MRRLASSLALVKLRADREAFVETYNEGLGKLEEEYAKMLKDPAPERVHDARTATRRAQAYMALLPKDLRRAGSARDLGKRYRDVMEATAAVRDKDVLAQKLSGSRTAKADLIGKVEKERTKAAKKACAAVSRAQRLQPPAVGKRDVPAKALQRRFEEVTGRLAEKVDELVPEVLASPHDIKRLHKLRIDLKKLRYLVEAVTEEGAAVLSRLERLQDVLGEVHDLDNIMAYVAREDPGFTGLSGWAAQRQREFGRFRRSVNGKGAGC